MRAALSAFDQALSLDPGSIEALSGALEAARALGNGPAMQAYQRRLGGAAGKAPLII